MNSIYTPTVPSDLTGGGCKGCADTSNVDCGVEVCGQFEFATPAILYNKCVGCEKNVLYDLYQVIDGEECFVKHISGKFPYKEKFEITGNYIVKWCVDDCSVCPAPEYYVSPLPNTSIPNYDVEKITYCNTDTNTQWVKTCVFTIGLDGVVAITTLSDDDTGFECGAAIPQFDIEVMEYCNPITETKWIKHFRFVTSAVGGVVTTTEETIKDTDTGFPCVDPIIVENNYCKV